jgi:hypothetical protein
MAISDEGDESDVSKPNYFGKEYISPKADLEVFLKPQKPLTTVLTHPIAVVSCASIMLPARGVDMDRCMMRAAAVHRVPDCVAEGVRPIIPSRPSRYDFRRYKNPPRA